MRRCDQTWPFDGYVTRCVKKQGHIGCHTGRERSGTVRSWAVWSDLVPPALTLVARGEDGPSITYDFPGAKR